MTISRFDLIDQQMTVQAGTVLKVLGRSPLSILDILLRESIQNSLDACNDGRRGSVEFKFDVINFFDPENLVEKLNFLRGASSEDLLFERLMNRVRENDPVLLVFSDTGTTGLSGPVRRTDPSWHVYEGRKNFENLIYQLGVNHGSVGSGGSYGFGKSIYYHLSSSGLVMYYSRCKEGERLIFSMISPVENRENKGSTGISWWGDIYNFNDCDYSSPIEDGNQIAKILQILGLSEKRYSEGETGTLICIIAVKLRNLLDIEFEQSEADVVVSTNDLDSEIEKLKALIEKKVLRWFWPRMTITPEVNEVSTLKPLKFYFNDLQLKLREPYISMGQLLLDGENLNNNINSHAQNDVKVEKLQHTYGNVVLGALAFKIFDFSAQQEHLNKILMIRYPRMVVFEVPINPGANRSFVALFLLNSLKEVQPNKINNNDKKILNDIFRDCESATHSEWNYQELNADKSWFKSYVKYVKERTQKIIRDSLDPVSLTDSSKNPYSKVAKTIGGLLMSNGGSSIQTFSLAKKGSVPSKGSSSVSKPKFRILSSDFTVDGLIQLKLALNTIREHDLKLAITASNGRNRYNEETWKENLGKDFPFKIIDCIAIPESAAFKIDSFTIGVVPAANEIELTLSVQAIKKDALISFEFKNTV